MSKRSDTETMEQLADRLHPGNRTSRRGKTAAIPRTDYGFGDPVIVSGRSSANAQKQLDKRNARKRVGWSDTDSPTHGARVKGDKEIVGGGF